MRKLIALLSLFLSLLTSCMSTKPVTASPQPSGNPTGGPLAKTDSLKPSTKLTIGAGISLMNTFKVGNANEFYQYISGNPSWTLDDGANGFKFFSLGFQSTSKKSLVGIELQYVLTHPSHAIYGEDHNGAYATKMYFSAKFINMAFLLGVPVGKKSFFVFEPGMDIGKMEGKIGIYTNPSPKEWTESGATDLGWHFAMGLDLALGKAFMITLRGGYRHLVITESHADATSSSGYSSFYANGMSGDVVKVDWSGMYVNAGIALTLGK